MRILFFISHIFIFTVLGNLNAYALIPGAQQTLDIDSVAAVQPINEVTAQDVTQFVPTQFDKDSNESDIALKIAKQSAKTLLKSEAIKKSAIGKTAEAVKEGVSTNIQSAPTIPGEEIVTHKIRFQFDPIKAEAKIKYSGFTDAQSIYDENGFRFEIKEKINDRYDLLLKHEMNNSLSTVQILIPWN